jgi:O-antigen ligase
LKQITKINFQTRVAYLLLSLFFLIPAFTILGPFFPDLIISVTVIFSLIVSLYDRDQKLLNLIIKDKFIIIFLLFSFYLLVNSFINYFDNAVYSYQNFKSYFSRSLFFFRFGIYPISVIYLANKFNFSISKKYLIIFLITIFFIIFDLIFQYFNGKDIFGFVPIERGVLAIGRLSGPFNDELIPGGFLMRYFFISMLFLFFTINNKNSLSFAIPLFILITLMTIFITGERSAAILTVFGIFLFFLLYPEFRIKIIFSFLICMGLVALFFLNNPVLKKRMVDDTLFQMGVSNNFNKEKPIHKQIINITKIKFLDSHYGAHWETSYRIWSDNKFFGIGLKQFRIECANKKYDDLKSKLRVIRCATHPHNTYFELLSEIGLIGFLLFLMLIFALFRKIFFIINSHEFIKLPLISVILIVWPLITTGSFFTNMTQIHFSFILTIIFMMEKNFFRKFES